MFIDSQNAPAWGVLFFNMKQKLAH